MKSRSAKNKGARLQNWLRDQWVRMWPGLVDLIVPKQMGGAGIDVELYGQAMLDIPFDVECKNVEKLPLWQALKQMEDNRRQGRAGLLVFKRNHSKTYVCLEWQDFEAMRGSYAAVKLNREETDGV